MAVREPRKILSKKWYAPTEGPNVVYWYKTWSTWAAPTNNPKKKKLTRFKKIFAYLVIENITISPAKTRTDRADRTDRTDRAGTGYHAAITLKYAATKFECDPYNGLCSMASKARAAPIRHHYSTMNLTLNQKVHLPDEAGHRATARIRFDTAPITTTFYVNCTPVAGADRKSKKQLAILSEDFDKGLLKAFCVHGMSFKKGRNK